MYASKMRALIADAISEFDELIEDDPDQDVGDLIFQIADGWTPIYSGEILEVVSEDLLWQVNAELGFLAARFADRLAETNPNFDRQRFVDVATGVRAR